MSIRRSVPKVQATETVFEAEDLGFQYRVVNNVLEARKNIHDTWDRSNMHNVYMALPTADQLRAAADAVEFYIGER